MHAISAADKHRAARPHTLRSITSQLRILRHGITMRDFGVSLPQIAAFNLSFGHMLQYSKRETPRFALH